AGAACFAAAWIVTLVAGRAGAAPMLVAALAVFAVGETLIAPSMPALVNDLAPDVLRGRYNAVFTLSWQLGAVIGPALAGTALGHGQGSALFLALAAACLAASFAAVTLERFVPPDVDAVLRS